MDIQHSIWTLPTRLYTNDVCLGFGWTLLVWYDVCVRRIMLLERVECVCVNGHRKAVWDPIALHLCLGLLSYVRGRSTSHLLTYIKHRPTQILQNLWYVGSYIHDNSTERHSLLAVTRVHSNTLEVNYGHWTLSGDTTDESVYEWCVLGVWLDCFGLIWYVW